jgi:hypothetical protein
MARGMMALSKLLKPSNKLNQTPVPVHNAEFQSIK